MDEAGYDCSSNVGLDCLDVFDSDQFLAWGYTFDQWLEVLYNCPQSCGLDCISETCDVSSLLENATEFGSCSAELTSGTSCTNTPRDGFSCTPSVCVHGVLLAGVCEGKCTDGTFLRPFPIFFFAFLVYLKISLWV